MAQIKHFVVETAADLRSGKQSWRVLGMLWSVALAISVTTAMMH
jgi:hypothetical protein